MIPALVAVVFFVAVSAALHFSAWAEDWLAPSARSKTERMPEAAQSSVTSATPLSSMANTIAVRVA